MQQVHSVLIPKCIYTAAHGLTFDTCDSTSDESHSVDDCTPTPLLALPVSVGASPFLKVCTYVRLHVYHYYLHNIIM